MSIIGLFQNPGEFISTLVLFITLVVLIFYTVATFGLKKATVKQRELSLRPFVVICALPDNEGHHDQLVYKNIGHSPALDVRTLTFDAGAFLIDFMSQSLIEVGEKKELSPKARGKDDVSEGLIRALADPGFAPRALTERASDLNLVLIVSYKNIEQTLYKTKIQLSKAGIEILETDKM